MANDSILRPGELKDILLREIASADLGTEDVTVASIGERHGRDEVTYALIVSLAEPVDPDRSRPSEVRMF